MKPLLAEEKPNWIDTTHNLHQPIDMYASSGLLNKPDITNRLTRFQGLSASSESQLFPLCVEKQETDRLIRAGIDPLKNAKLNLKPLKEDSTYYDPRNSHLQDVIQGYEDAIKKKLKERKILAYKEAVKTIPIVDYYPTTELAKLKSKLSQNNDEINRLNCIELDLKYAIKLASKGNLTALYQYFASDDFRWVLNRDNDSNKINNIDNEEKSIEDVIIDEKVQEIVSGLEQQTARTNYQEIEVGVEEELPLSGLSLADYDYIHDDAQPMETDNTSNWYSENDVIDVPIETTIPVVSDRKDDISVMSDSNEDIIYGPKYYNPNYYDELFNLDTVNQKKVKSKPKSQPTQEVTVEEVKQIEVIKVETPSPEIKPVKKRETPSPHKIRSRSVSPKKIIEQKPKQVKIIEIEEVTTEPIIVPDTRDLYKEIVEEESHEIAQKLIEEKMTLIVNEMVQNLIKETNAHQNEALETIIETYFVDITDKIIQQMSLKLVDERKLNVNEALELIIDTYLVDVPNTIIQTLSITLLEEMKIDLNDALRSIAEIEAKCIADSIIESVSKDVAKELLLAKVVIEEHVVIEELDVVEVPVVVEEPIVIEEPVVVEVPVVVEEPIVIEEPVVVEVPVVVEEPIVIEDTVVEEPVVIEQHVVVEEPIVVAQPVVVEQIEEPVAQMPIDEPQSEPELEEPVVINVAPSVIELPKETIVEELPPNVKSKEIEHIEVEPYSDDKLTEMHPVEPIKFSPDKVITKVKHGSSNTLAFLMSKRSQKKLFPGSSPLQTNRSDINLTNRSAVATGLQTNNSLKPPTSVSTPIISLQSKVTNNENRKISSEAQITPRRKVSGEIKLSARQPSPRITISPRLPQPLPHKPMSASTTSTNNQTRSSGVAINNNTTSISTLAVPDDLTLLVSVQKNIDEPTKQNDYSNIHLPLQSSRKSSKDSRHSGREPPIVSNLNTIAIDKALINAPIETHLKSNIESSKKSSKVDHLVVNEHNITKDVILNSPIILDKVDKPKDHHVEKSEKKETKVQKSEKIEVVVRKQEKKESIEKQITPQIKVLAKTSLKETDNKSHVDKDESKQEKQKPKSNSRPNSSVRSKTLLVKAEEVQKTNSRPNSRPTSSARSKSVIITKPDEINKSRPNSKTIHSRPTSTTKSKPIVVKENHNIETIQKEMDDENAHDEIIPTDLHLNTNIDIPLETISESTDTRKSMKNPPKTTRKSSIISVDTNVHNGSSSGRVGTPTLTPKGSVDQRRFK